MVLYDKLILILFIAIFLSFVTAYTLSDIVFDSKSKDVLQYSTWAEFDEAYLIGADLSAWDACGISKDCITLCTMHFSDQETVYSPIFVWEDSRTAVFENSSDYEDSALQAAGWKCFPMDCDPAGLAEAVQKKAE